MSKKVPHRLLGKGGPRVSAIGFGGAVLSPGYFESVDDEAGDEFQFSDIIAGHFNTEHHKIFFDSQRLLPALTECVEAMS